MRSVHIESTLILFCLLILQGPVRAGKLSGDGQAETNANAEETGASSDQALDSILLLEETPPLVTGADDSTEFERVIVTATKREQLLNQVPASISVFGGEELEDLGATSLRDFLSRVPGMAQTEIANDYSRIAVRGIQSDSAAVTPAATGYFIDDVPFSDPFLLHGRPDLPPFDLAAVELLKGPQGTLFGGSALAGAIRYRLMDAQPGQWDAKGFAQYRSQSDGESSSIGGAALNMPLGEDAGLRLVSVRRLQGGRIDDLRNGQTDTDDADHLSSRALLRWDLDDHWSIGLKAFSQKSRAEDLPVSETRDGRLERERALRKAPYETSADFLSLDLTRHFPWADFISVSSLLHKDADHTGRGAERSLGVEDTGQPVDAPLTENIRGFVQELRLVSRDEAFWPWQWLGGLYAHDYQEFTTQRLVTREESSGLAVEFVNYAGDIRARELAVFGEVGREIGQRWRVTVGLRGYWIQTEGETLTTGVIILATGNTENRNDANLQASGLNPRLAVQLYINDSLSSYFSVARGFRFGGIQLTGPSPVNPDAKTTYDPDSVWSYEWGLRSLWLADTLQVDGALFYIDWNTPQVQTTTGGAVPLNTIDNVGQARSYGAELNARYRPPVPGLLARISAAYTNARTTVAYTAPGGAEVAAGSRLPGSADHQIVASLDYSRGWRGFEARLSLSHNIQGRGVNDILQSQDILGYETTDVRLSLRTPGQARLSLGVTNVADNRAVVRASVVDEDNFTTVYNRTRSFDLRFDLSL